MLELVSHVNTSRFLLQVAWDIDEISYKSVTYDHRLRKIGHPVRSAIHKPQIGRLVVGWVTTSEYLLLYVFGFVVRLTMAVLYVED